MLLFTAYSIRIARVDATPLDIQQLRRQAADRSPRLSGRPLAGLLAAVVGGLALLIGGGRVLVDGAVGVAHGFDISERVIGLTVVAAGTSAPELATSIIAAFRGESEIAIANLIGSNIFNILGILGLAGILTLLTISPAILRHDLWWLLGTAALLLPLMRAGMRLSRGDGMVLGLTYVAYVLLLLR
jgi:cation:H+ antiporter